MKLCVESDNPFLRKYKLSSKVKVSKMFKHDVLSNVFQKKPIKRLSPLVTDVLLLS